MGISGSRCFDLFSGTSVVSQALAGLENRVTAVDAQTYCGVIGGAMLGEGRKGNETISKDVFKFLSGCISKYAYEKDWSYWLKEEDNAILHRDFEGLSNLNSIVPVWWRANTASTGIDLQQHVGEEAFHIGPLITSIYAGSYFGVRQSLAVDALRSGIENLWNQKWLTHWQKNCCLTALMAACSKAAYSAGKHFAQPLTSGKSGSGFRLGRLIQDRAIDVEKEFKKALNLIITNARKGSEGHSFQCRTVEASLADIVKTRPALVYADPPYTAQQYSRFYHLLDTVASYRVPDLLHRGRVTSGLYPVERFKSAFCSKRKAKDAIAKLLKAVHAAGSALVLSYSASRKGSDGNARMIDADGLVAECSAVYGSRSVTVRTLGHSYRQFNSSILGNANRSDPEILICCRS